MNKIEKYADFGQARKISVQLDDEYYKNRRTIKSEKIMILFAKIWTEKRKLS